MDVPVRLHGDQRVAARGREVEAVRRPSRVSIAAEEALRAVLLHDPCAGDRIDEEATRRGEGDELVPRLLAADRVADRPEDGEARRAQRGGRDRDAPGGGEGG